MFRLRKTANEIEAKKEALRASFVQSLKTTEVNKLLVPINAA